MSIGAMHAFSSGAQAIVLRDTSRLDDAGAAKSRGVGFVEFEEHEHALACLRQLNNNPNVVSPLKRPIVEFAIENAQIVKARERAARRAAERRAQVAQAETGAYRTSSISLCVRTCGHLLSS